MILYTEYVALQNDHITLLELRSVLYSVQTFRHELRGHTVQLWEDNQAVVAKLKSWTTKSPDMMRILPHRRVRRRAV